MYFISISINFNLIDLVKKGRKKKKSQFLATDAFIVLCIYCIMTGHDIWMHLHITFMLLADAFVQSDLYCMQGTHIFISVLASWHWHCWISNSQPNICTLMCFELLHYTCSALQAFSSRKCKTFFFFLCDHSTQDLQNLTNTHFTHRVSNSNRQWQ